MVRSVHDVLAELTHGSNCPYRRGGFDRWWKHIVRWPPDVFAVTSTLLSESGAYRLAVSPPETDPWPICSDRTEWCSRVFSGFAQWLGWIAAGGVEDQAPPVLRDCGAALERVLDSSVCRLADAPQLQACDAILRLHAMADEACAGLGVPDSFMIEETNNRLAPMRLEAELNLAFDGTLSRLSPERIRVLPKLRTPQSGITIRSLSHHLAISRSEVDTSWSVHPGGLHPLAEPRAKRLNLLLVPWPFELDSTAFQEIDNPEWNRAARHSGAFEYKPRVRDGAVVDEIAAGVDAARNRGFEVHGVILPEGALTRAEFADTAGLLQRRNVGLLLSGIRGNRSNTAKLALHFHGDPGGWHVYEQPKHHRWCIDAPQIYQYHLGAALHPERKLWEDIRIPARTLNIVALNSWLTLCHLICEDLARLDPVSDIIRAIGPNLVIALLLDGPQLQARWPGRYASVLADDPGSSVLTLSALGMVQRSLPRGAAPSRVVGLWKDARRGTHELVLAPNAKALLITLCAEFGEEASADGRSDHGMAGHLVLGGIEQVQWQAGVPASESSTTAELTSAHEAELTALCFLTDALASAPLEHERLLNVASQRLQGDVPVRALQALQQEFSSQFRTGTVAGMLGKLIEIKGRLCDDNRGNDVGVTLAGQALAWTLHGRIRMERRPHADAAAGLTKR